MNSQRMLSDFATTINCVRYTQLDLALLLFFPPFYLFFFKRVCFLKYSPSPLLFCNVYKEDISFVPPLFLSLSSAVPVYYIHTLTHCTFCLFYSIIT